LLLCAIAGPIEPLPREIGLHNADFGRYSAIYDLDMAGQACPGQLAGGPMRLALCFRTFLVIAAASFPLSIAALAQAPAPVQSAPPRAAAPAAPRPAATADAQPTLLGQFGDWGAYTASPGGRKVCFALAKATSSQTNPPNRPRDEPFFFVSTRPAERVREEVSIIIGYPFKPNSEATVDIGTTNFALYTQGDGAWIKNAAEEARMIDAMRRGADLVVRGVSGRGTQTTDVFSLKGISQALDRAAQECS
jgi:invasion protein IalB